MSRAEVAKPRVVAWETTRACPLACIHCRAEARHVADPRQLSTVEGMALLANIAGMGGGGPTIVILTGGEPLTRPDVFDLAAHGASLGLYMAISPDDGRLLTPETCARLKGSGIRQLSFSLHYPDPAENDYFARTPGAFDAARQGLANLRAVGLPYQINTTVTRRNADRLPAMYELVKSLEPVCWIFFLVPTGRARMLAADEMPPEQYERVLNWLLDLQRASPLPIKQTCAPHFRRIERQRAPEVEQQPAQSSPGFRGLLTASDYSRRHSATSRGCMCGNGFVFVSHVGDVQGCGYLPLAGGNVRDRPFSEIYTTSPTFAELRDPALLGGKCGLCQFRQVCGGCRARAYSESGDYLAEEPYCTYDPFAMVADR